MLIPLRLRPFALLISLLIAAGSNADDYGVCLYADCAEDLNGPPQIPGHVFVELILPSWHPQHGARRRGFYPTGLWVFGGRGEIRDDHNRDWEWRICYTIDAAHYDSAANVVNSYVRNPPPYNLCAANCGDFALAVASAAGVRGDLPRIEDLTHHIADPHGFGLSLRAVGDGNTTAGGGLVTRNPLLFRQGPVPRDFSYGGLQHHGHATPQDVADAMLLPLDSQSLGSLTARTNALFFVQVQNIQANEALISVDWGDGADLQANHTSFWHAYATAGTYHGSVLVIDQAAVRRYSMVVQVTDDGVSSDAVIQVSDSTPADGDNPGFEGATELLLANPENCSATFRGPTGACCTPDGSCYEGVMEECCLNYDGTFSASGTCESTGACCLTDHSCLVTSEQCCLAAGGIFTANADCGDSGACRIGNECIDTTAACCAAAGGTFSRTESCSGAGCAIVDDNSAEKARKGVRSAWAIMIPPPAATRGSVQASIDSSRVLNITGTPDADRVRIVGGAPGYLDVYSPENETNPLGSFALADFDRLYIDCGAQTDLVVFDDSQGHVAPLRPYEIRTGAGDDLILTRTGPLTLEQALDVIDTLQSARNLVVEAETILALVGAAESVGSGDNLLGRSVDLLEQVNRDFVLPARDLALAARNTLVQPTITATGTTRTRVIDGALTLTSQAHSRLATAALLLRDDMQRDIVDVAHALKKEAENRIVPAADQASACGESLVVGSPSEAAAFVSRMNLLADRIAAEADDCPEKGIEPPEQPNGCAVMYGYLACLEREFEDFQALVEACERDGEEFESDADEYGARLENLEQTGELFEARLDQLEGDADADADVPGPNPFTNQADAYAADAERYADELASQLADAGDRLFDQADAAFAQSGAQLQLDAEARVGALADEIEAHAEQLIAEAEGIIAAAAVLLDDAGRGDPLLDCKDIHPINHIIGGPGFNLLIGGIGDDHIEGLGGFDLIVGGPGNDLLEGGDGIDVIFGGSGTNQIHGGKGLDILIGGNSTDCIYGEDDLDIIWSRGGDDYIEGGPYIDILLAGPGMDVADGGDGIDLVYGGLDNDLLRGGNCIDVILGAAGDDTLIGGAGQTVARGSLSIDLGDAIFGGEGNDVIFGDEDDGTGSGIDVIFGRAGIDTIYGGDGGELTIGSFTIQLGNLCFGGTEKDIITGGAGIDLLLGFDGPDELDGGAGAVLELDDGDFRLELGDILLGGLDGDIIVGGSSDDMHDIDVIIGYEGDDIIDAGHGGMLKVGDDVELMLGNFVFGGPGIDTISAGDGFDFIFGGTEGDFLSGGAGYNIKINDFEIDLGDFIFGQAGDDYLHGDAPTLPSVARDDGIDVLFGGDGVDHLYGGTGGTIKLNGDCVPLQTVCIQFGNFFFGGLMGDTIVGDYMTTSATDRPDGIDFIVSDGGDDTIDSGDGADLLFPDVPFYLRFGDIVFTSNGIDRVDGSDGLDLIFTGSEKDIIHSKSGIDIVFSGDGPDEVYAAEGGIVVVPISGVPTPIPLGNIVFSGDGDDVIYSGGAPADPDNLLMGEIDIIFAGRCDDEIHAGDGLLDLIFAGTGRDCVFGEGGTDLAFGGKGSDTIDLGGALLLLVPIPDVCFGGRDHDTISCGDAVNVVFAGQESDDITGGDGLLTVNILFANRGPDRIVGGNSFLNAMFGGMGGDRIEGGQSAVDIALGGANSDVLIAHSLISVFFGNGDNDEMFASDSVNLMFGNSGADWLVGGSTLDLMFGGPDPDQIQGEGGVDLLFGGLGNDLIFGGGQANLLFGGFDNDILVGGPDLDILLGSFGDDRLYGQSAGGIANILLGGFHSDELVGGDELDLEFGGWGSDLIFGGGSRDIAAGFFDSDRLQADGGSDLFFGGGENDQVYAGTADSDKDYLFGGFGTDILDGCPNSQDKRLGGPGSDTKSENCSSHSLSAMNFSTLRGHVMLDRDGDTTPDGGFVGVTVFLDLDSDGTSNASVTTATDDVETYLDESGRFEFKNVPAGAHRLKHTPPPGYSVLSPGPTIDLPAIGSFERLDQLNFIDQDDCPPVSPPADPCANCACPPGTSPVVRVQRVHECANDGTACDDDADCPCGIPCAEREVVDCECVPTCVCLLAGDKDGFAGSSDFADRIVLREPFRAWLARPGGNIAVFHAGQPQPFDVPNQARDWDFGYSFLELPDAAAATLEIHLLAGPSLPGTDGLALQFASDPVPHFAWSISLNQLEGLQGGDGTWGANEDRIFHLDLAALRVPGGTPVDLIAQLNADGYLDVYVQDDTAVDYIELCITRTRTNEELAPPRLPMVVCDGERVDPVYPIHSQSLGSPQSLPGAQAGSGTRGDPLPPNPPRAPPSPHDMLKNRYVSFVPNNPSNPVAFEVTIEPCRRAWVAEPILLTFDGADPTYVSELTNRPVYRVWTEDVVHVRGCLIAPGEHYTFRACTTEPLCSEAAPFRTVARWGDLVGPLSGASWGPPDGLVDANDILAVVSKQVDPFASIHTTRADLTLLWVDYRIDASDVAAVCAAREGQLYPPPDFGLADLVDCPLEPPCPSRCGDLNGDGVVDTQDFLLFLGAYGHYSHEAEYNPCADFNGDGHITSVDYESWVDCSARLRRPV